MSEPTAAEINRQLKKILKWLPLILGMCALIGLAITLRGVYDNDVAKKSDIEILSKKIDGLTNQIGDLSVRFNAFKVDDSNIKARAKYSVDSMQMVVNSVKKQYSKINHKVSFLMEIKRHGPNSLPDLVPVR